jgi:dTDP-glucose 4,6-dehydratase
VRAYAETYGLPITITNCANNYGEYQFPEKVIPLFATNAIDGRPLPLYASTDNRREWIHVLDHCRAIDAVLQRGRIGETYHVGTGTERSILEIADAVLEALEKPPSLKTIVPDRPGHDRRYVLDWTKIRTELGWDPTIDFDNGLRATVRWYRDHRAWWAPLRDRAPVAEGSGWAGAPVTSS